MGIENCLISPDPSPHPLSLVPSSVRSLHFLPPQAVSNPSTRDLVTANSRHFHCWKRSGTSSSAFFRQVPTPGQSLWLHGCAKKMLAAPIQTTWLESGKGLFSSRRECCSRKIHNRGSPAIVHDLHVPFLQLDCLVEGTSFSSGLESSALVWNLTPPRSFESRTAVDPVTS